MNSLIRDHRLSVFFVLAFLLSWYPWVLALVQGRTTGPNPLGPLVAGIILTAIAYGRPGLRQFFARIVRWRVGFRWYAIAFGLPIAVCLGAVGITFVSLKSVTISPLSVDKIRELPERFLFILLFIGLGEEPGWRGFALRELQSRFSATKASLLLAPIWTIWHLPLIGNEFAWPIVPAFVVSVFGATFMQTWLFNRTNESVLLPMLFHATVNAVGAGIIFPLFSGPSFLLLWWIYSLLWLLIGLGLVVRDQRIRTIRQSEMQVALPNQRFQT